MTINIRAKGQNGEREIADALNLIVNALYKELGMAVPPKPVVQRNQNQSAVGGCDLSNTFGLAIEVKRQEALSINTWWKQCDVSAKERGELPVLLFRQNKMKWRCILMVELPLPSSGRAHVRVRAEITFEDFKEYFTNHTRAYLLGNRELIEAVEYPGLFDANV